MNVFVEKLASLWPEMIMLTGVVACLATGLWNTAAVRRATPIVAGLTMLLAWLATLYLTIGVDPAADTHPLGFGGMVPFIKCFALLMGLLLLMVNVGLPERIRQTLAAESTAEGKSFEPGDTMRGEFYAFFLLSVTGVMLTAGATDLVWLFLALELTSLPTYVMIATSRDRMAGQESAIKYFFLGALSAAIFLYGFAMIFGATGFTEFGAIAAAVNSGTANMPLLLLGVVLSILGLCYKIAAVPMHVYAADVYEGAATPVAAFLAVIPKTAGFAALILVVGLVGWNPLPVPVAYLLCGIAILTMTVGNVLAIIQTNLKRVLAYSSVAHSGYLLTGLVAGLGTPGEALGNGPAAILFYLVAYGPGTIGAFVVLACLARINRDGSVDADPEQVTYDDLSGLWWKHPILASIMLVSMLSLVGMPPLAGFVGKVYLIGGVFTAGYITLAIIIVLNSAISAGYYLRIAMACFFGQPQDVVLVPRRPWAMATGIIVTVAAFGFGGYFANGIIERSHDAVAVHGGPPQHALPPVVAAGEP